MDITEIAEQIKECGENIVLIYAFNATGKTRLSVEYKNITKQANENTRAGVYYNAYSEDLFVWENDERNGNQDIKLNVLKSSLNQFHSFIDVPDIEEKLKMYIPRYTFKLNLYANLEDGIKSISFYMDEEQKIPIKISRGEERIFVWCFFLTLFGVDAWAGEQDAHFFIDDPVSSLDEHNIFITAEYIFDLIEKNYLKKRIVITTHHIGLFSILFDKLKKGEKSGKYKELTKPFILKREENKLMLKSCNKDVFLFHLHLLQELNEAYETEALYAYHFVLLRQLLENISSFLGSGRIGYLLEQIGLEDTSNTMDRINSLSHRSIYAMESNKMSESEEELFKRVLEKIQSKYQFKI